MLSLAFVGAAEDLVFYGKTGRGKTHMATAVGIAAASAGYPVRFFQTAQLVLQLGKAKREGTLDGLLADLAKARLLVLDEFGYVPFDVDGARLLYQVISESYERRSIVFTTNVEFSRWGTVFADDKLARVLSCKEKRAMLTIEEAIRQRHSVRQYTDEPISADMCAAPTPTSTSASPSCTSSWGQGPTHLSGHRLTPARPPDGCRPTRPAGTPPRLQRCCQRRQGRSQPR